MSYPNRPSNQSQADSDEKDSTPFEKKHNAVDMPPGPRTTDKQFILDYEADRDVENPAVPFSIVDSHTTVEDWQALLNSELERENPRQHIVGYANRRINYLEDN